MFFFICRIACCWALRKPITSVEFKFLARQVGAPVVIRAAKLNIVAESRTRVYFVQHHQCCLNLQHCILLRNKLVTNVVIRATEGFNLQCNKVARQVGENCCSYYRTLSPSVIRACLNSKSTDGRGAERTGNLSSDLAGARQENGTREI